MFYGLKADRLSIRCFRHTIVRFRYKSIFMKLFKTNDIETVKYCQYLFRFELPSVHLNGLKKEILASYSSAS